MLSLGFKDRLKSLRNERGLTQEELAEALGFPHSTIRRYETSDDGMPKHERLENIADFFDCSVDYLLERTNERSKQNKKESAYTLPEEVILNVIREAEAEFKVSLRDDPLVESAVRDLIQNLAKMKRGFQKND